jgi:hypothetical protein
MKIKQSILPLVALLSFLNCHFINAEETPPLKIEAGEEWKVEFMNEEGVNFFTINQKVGGDGQMMISRWPVPGGVEQIASSMQLIVNSFIEVAKENPNLQLKEKKAKLENIKGVEIEGEVAIFELKLGIFQTMFMFHDGIQTWNGQFTGSKKDWVKAKKVIEQITKTPGIESPKSE